MTEPRDQPDALPDADATDADVEQIIPPEQPPMDDAAGGPTVDVEAEDDENGPDDLTVQGGE
jgi:hypothetical protein